MEEFKGTKGEWTYNYRTVYTKENILNSTICVNPYREFNSFCLDDTWEYNAKLISSCPDMLKACIIVKDKLAKLIANPNWDFNALGSIWNEFKILESVINKALK